MIDEEKDDDLNDFKNSCLYLNVNYNQIKIAKKYKCKWNPDYKKWYISFFGIGCPSELTIILNGIPNLTIPKYIKAKSSETLSFDDAVNNYKYVKKKYE